MSGPTDPRTVSASVDVVGAADDPVATGGAEPGTPEVGAGARVPRSVPCAAGGGVSGAAEHAATPADPRAPAAAASTALRDVPRRTVGTATGRSGAGSRGLMRLSPLARRREDPAVSAATAVR